MTAYYYPAASLPMLRGPDQPPPITSEKMLDVCSRYLASRDYDALHAATLKADVESASGICLSYYLWEMSLRNELVRYRAVLQGLAPDEFLRESPDIFGSTSIAYEAMAIKSPLEAEMYLDGCRWAKIEELSAGHYFDIDFLLAYRLKLQILERHVMFEQERGFAAYQRLYTQVFEAAAAVLPTEGAGT